MTLVIPGRIPRMTGVGRAINITVDPVGIVVERQLNKDIKMIGENITVVLKAASLCDMKLDTDVPEYQTDLGFRVSDHLALKAPEFEIEFMLSDEWEFSQATGLVELVTHRDELLSNIRQIRANRELFRLETNFGELDSMVMTTFSAEVSNKALNSYDCRMGVKRVIRGIVALVEVQWIKDPDTGQIIDTAFVDGSYTEVDLTLFTPEATTEKSILEKMAEWLTDW